MPWDAGTPAGLAQRPSPSMHVTRGTSILIVCTTHRPPQGGSHVPWGAWAWWQERCKGENQRMAREALSATSETLPKSATGPRRHRLAPAVRVADSRAILWHPDGCGSRHQGVPLGGLPDRETSAAVLSSRGLSQRGRREGSGSWRRRAISRRTCRPADRCVRESSGP